MQCEVAQEHWRKVWKMPDLWYGGWSILLGSQKGTSLNTLWIRALLTSWASALNTQLLGLKLSP